MSSSRSSNRQRLRSRRSQTTRHQIDVGLSVVISPATRPETALHRPSRARSGVWAEWREVPSGTTLGSSIWSPKREREVAVCLILSRRDLLLSVLAAELFTRSMSAIGDTTGITWHNDH